jgi:hypothetical protein
VSALDGRSLGRREDASRVIAELCHLPLAIAQAAAYRLANKVSFQGYLALLKEQEEDVVELLSEDFEVDGR